MESELSLVDLPSEVLTHMLNFVDGLTLLEIRRLNRAWLRLPENFYRLKLQEQLQSVWANHVIKLNVTLAISLIRERFNERLTLILTDPLDINSQFVWLDKPNLTTLRIPELRYCIIYLTDKNINQEDVQTKLSPEQLLWLSTNSLKEIEEIVDEDYSPLTSDIMNKYKDILLNHLSLIQRSN